MLCKSTSYKLTLASFDILYAYTTLRTTLYNHKIRQKFKESKLIVMYVLTWFKKTKMNQGVEKGSDFSKAGERFFFLGFFYSRKRERSSIIWFTPQVVAMTRAKLI